MCHLMSYILIVSICLFVQAEQSSDGDDGRIVGGEPADIKDIPYQLSLRDRNSNFHFCGASIISANWAISAAHCFHGKNIEMVIAVAGSTLTSQKKSVHQITKSITHPLYNKQTYDFDVTVLHVAEIFALGTLGVDCIALANIKPSEGTLAQVSGWGKTRESGNASKHLLKVEVPIISNVNCKQLLYPYSITDHMVCAGYKTGAKDSCNGDSGGPLVIQNKLVGIVSWGIGCAQPTKPGVYTRIDVLRKWIISVTKIPECKAFY